MSLHEEDVEMYPDGEDIPDIMPEKPDTARRGYSSPYTIRFTGSQRDRFPPSARAEIRSMLVNDNDREPYPVGFTGEWEDFPRVARMRMNLTALSQHYDLYFVAYRGYIHVYRPNRNAKWTIRGPPLVILDPEQSETPMAEFAHGHVNPTCPHEVNHMVVGDLGEQEILLIARDNGDVVAWYTHTIAHAIETSTAWQRHPHDLVRENSSSKPPSPKHFFATSVGLSAWGLAIHTKSRLIAVSANTSEVTVFAFALGGGDDAEGQVEPMPAGVHPPPPPSPMCEEAQRARSTLKEAMGTRKRTWRIIITLSREASNLPSISFCNDAHGDADRIAAIDIHGCLWIADIWKVGTRRVGIYPHNVQYPQGRPYTNVTGWNVLAVTDAQLLPTKTVRAAIGLRPSRAVHRPKTAPDAWYDISKSMAQVKDDAAHEDHIARMRLFRTEDVNNQNDGPAKAVTMVTSLSTSKTVTIPTTDPSEDENQDGYLPAMTMLNGTGEHRPEITDAREHMMFLKGSIFRKADFPKASPLSPCGAAGNDAGGGGGGGGSGDEVSLRGLSFLRANSEDVEMLNLDANGGGGGGGGGVACHHVLPGLTHDESLVPWDYHGLGKRVAMLLTVPELHLVVLGSMHGRVALVTLTKPPRTEGSRVPSRAFRVDAVLPFESEVRRQPWVCLLGIAVSPIPETRAQGLRLRKRRPAVYGGRRKTAEVPDTEPDAPKKWRLILNYQDHTILQYEITRKEAGGGGEEEQEDRTPWEARALRKQGVEDGDGLGQGDGVEDEEGEDDWPLAEAA